MKIMFKYTRYCYLKHQRMLLKNTKNCYSNTSKILNQEHQKLLLNNTKNSYSKTTEIVTQIYQRCY